MEKDYKEAIINNLNEIKKDIENLCNTLKSSSLTTSTHNLTDLIQSITNAIKETMKENGESV